MFQLREVAGGRAQSQYVGVEAQVSTRTLSIAQWIETPIKIKLPFHKRALYPAHEEFEAGKLDRRKLVPEIRQEIPRSSYLPHLESTGLFDNKTKLSRELGLMSKAFIMTFKTHLENQDVYFQRS
jgi:hypothetical protein